MRRLTILAALALLDAAKAETVQHSPHQKPRASHRETKRGRVYPGGSIPGGLRRALQRKKEPGA